MSLTSLIALGGPVFKIELVYNYRFRGRWRMAAQMNQQPTALKMID
jgi:hypothetical protein